MVLYIYEKVRNNISNVFQLTERTRVHGRNYYVQRAIIPKSMQTRITFHMFCKLSHSALYLYEVP